MKLQPNRKAISVDTEALIDNLSGPEMVTLIREVMERIPFQEQVDDIRKIVNDPKWDDKV